MLVSQTFSHEEKAVLIKKSRWTVGVLTAWVSVKFLASSQGVCSSQKVGNLPIRKPR